MYVSHWLLTDSSLFSTLILKIPECVVYKFGIRNAIAQSKTQMRRKLFIHSWMTCYYHSDTIFNFPLTIYYINYMRNSIKYFVIFKRPLHWIVPRTVLLSLVTLFIIHKVTRLCSIGIASSPEMDYTCLV